MQSDCPGWTTDGECYKNPGFMYKECPNSCGVCEGVKCADNNSTQCAIWAEAGECLNNPLAVMKECPDSCGVRPRPSHICISRVCSGGPLVPLVPLASGVSCLVSAQRTRFVSAECVTNLCHRPTCTCVTNLCVTDPPPSLTGAWRKPGPWTLESGHRTLDPLLPHRVRDRILDPGPWTSLLSHRVRGAPHLHARAALLDRLPRPR